MENEHPYKKWENRKPQYEDFGFSASDIPRIKKAVEMYNSISSIEPSEKLKALKKKFEGMKRKDLGITEFIFYALCIFIVTVAIMSNGFKYFDTKMVAGGLFAAFILLIPLGPLTLLITSSTIHPIFKHIESKANEEYYEKQAEIARLEEDEKKQYERYIEATYGRDYALSANLNSYYNALNYYNDCRRASRSEYWNRFQGGDGNDFERACAKFLSDRGFSTRVTPIGPDKGIDIFAERDGQKYACQCKALGTKVSSGDIQKFIGVLVTGPYTAGFFFSLNGFSQNAIEVAHTSPKKIYCLSKRELMKGKIL